MFGITGFVYSWVMRAELGCVAEQLLYGDHQFYNVLITSHAMLMIFFFIMPALISGYGNLLLPVYCGVPEMVFPKMNNIALWLLPLAYECLLLSAQLDEGAGTAWTIYPPLAAYTSHCGLSVDIFIIALHMSGISSVLGGVNVLCTCLGARMSNRSMRCSSLYIWSLCWVALLVIAVIPVLAGCITMVLTDRSLNTAFFDVAGGGDLLLYQHLFWVFGHPEVYIIILPAFGMVSHCLHGTHGSHGLFNQLGMIYAIGSISFVGFFVWAHHMFTVGLDIDARVYFSSVTLLIALPTSIKIFSWLVCLLRAVCCDSVLLVVYCFIVMFTIGGVTGLVLANSEIDLVMHDSYFVVAHFHYVLSIGAVFGFLCGLLMSYTLVFGFAQGEHVMRVMIGLILLGVNSVFWCMHYAGLLGFPRRVCDYPDQFIGYAATSYNGLLMVLFSMVLLSIALVDVHVSVAGYMGWGTRSGAVRCVSVGWSAHGAVIDWLAATCCDPGQLMREYTICHTDCIENLSSSVLLVATYYGLAACTLVLAVIRKLLLDVLA